MCGHRRKCEHQMVQVRGHEGELLALEWSWITFSWLWEGRHGLPGPEDETLDSSPSALSAPGTGCRCGLMATVSTSPRTARC